MYEHYLISFQNLETGKTQEFYLFTTPENIEKEATELTNRFFGSTKNIIVHIYKRFKTLELGGYYE